MDYLHNKKESSKGIKKGRYFHIFYPICGINETLTWLGFSLSFRVE